MREVGVVINTHGEPIYWHEPRVSSVSIPDSAELWNAMWRAHRDGWLAGFAHSHPGNGLPSPSQEDLSSFVANESGLGRSLTWWITSSDRLVVITRSAMDSIPGREIYAVQEVSVHREPPWAAELRRRSNAAGEGIYR